MRTRASVALPETTGVVALPTSRLRRLSRAQANPPAVASPSEAPPATAPPALVRHTCTACGALFEVDLPRASTTPLWPVLVAGQTNRSCPRKQKGCPCRRQCMYGCPSTPTRTQRGHVNKDVQLSFVGLKTARPIAEAVMMIPKPGTSPKLSPVTVTTP